MCALAADRGTAAADLRKHAGATLRAEAPARFGEPSLPPGVAIEPQLTEDAAVAVALWNSPRLEAALAEVGLARADLAAAGLLRNPSFQVLFPVGPKPFESILQWPVEALWQRRRRVDWARLNVEAVAAAAVQNGLDLARDVRFAFHDLALAERRAAVAGGNAALRKRIAAMAQKQLEAGDISGMEASFAQVDAKAAAEDARRRLREIDAARERLRALIGLRGNVSALRTAAPSADPASPPEWRELVGKAVSQRPDLRAAELQVEAAAKRARWERSRLATLVAPLLSIKDIGSSGIRAGPGLAAEVPLFDRNQGGIARADAEVHRAAIRYAVLRDLVEGEIREALALELQAAESLARLRSDVLPEIERSIRLAEKAHAEGDVPYLFVLEAMRQRFDVEGRIEDARAAGHKARAQLEHGLGGKW